MPRGDTDACTDQRDRVPPHMGLVLVSGISTSEVTLRILAAGLLGAVIGVEREARSHAAGMKTHALVAGGAAIFTLAGAYGFGELQRSASVDPMRVAAQVVSGIGFVGAGAIIRHGASVRGLTTAATLWTSAAIGVATGAGFFSAAIVGVGVALVLLVLLRLLQPMTKTFMGARAHEVEIEVLYERGKGTMAALLTMVERSATIVGVRIADDGNRTEPGLRRVVVRARLDARWHANTSFDELTHLPEVRSLSVSKAAA